jgi:hypothetical protein
VALVIVSTFAVGAIVFGAVWLWRRSQAPPTTPSAGDLAPPAADTSPARVTEAPMDLPELDASDELIRRAVAGLSARPEWASWLVTDDMVRRFVVAVVAVAEGRSPEAQLRFLVPERPFSTRQLDGRTVVDPESYRRYDAAVATFASLDTEGAARLYRQMHPLMEEAYRELGLRERTFDQTLAVAVDNVLTAGVPDGPLDVEQEEGAYVFSAPGIEELSPVEKHLLRMGPDNARLLQAKLREIADALGVSP